MDPFISFISVFCRSGPRLETCKTRPHTRNLALQRALSVRNRISVPSRLIRLTPPVRNCRINWVFHCGSAATSIELDILWLIRPLGKTAGVTNRSDPAGIPAEREIAARRLSERDAILRTTTRKCAAFRGPSVVPSSGRNIGKLISTGICSASENETWQ